MTNNPMTNDPTRDDGDVDLWREQWSSVAKPFPEFQRRIQERINYQNRRFLIGNLLTAVIFVGMLIYAVFLSHQASRFRRGEAAGVFALLLVCVACRLWVMRGTWRADTRSTRAFVELWHRRVQARIRALQIAIYISIGWLVFCAALAAANWATIRLEVVAHPAECLALTVIIAIMLPVIWFGAMWIRRRKVAELDEVTRLLEGIRTNE